MLPTWSDFRTSWHGVQQDSGRVSFLPPLLALPHHHPLEVRLEPLYRLFSGLEAGRSEMRWVSHQCKHAFSPPPPFPLTSSKAALTCGSLRSGRTAKPWVVLERARGRYATSRTSSQRSAHNDRHSPSSPASLWILVKFRLHLLFPPLKHLLGRLLERGAEDCVFFRTQEQRRGLRRLKVPFAQD